MFYNQMRQQQNHNVQIDPNSRGQISNRQMQMLQQMLQQAQPNFLNPNLGLFGNTKGQNNREEAVMRRLREIHGSQFTEKEAERLMEQLMMQQPILQPLQPQPNFLSPNMRY